MNSTASPLVIETMPAAELARDQAWWDIYAESFPANVREPGDVIVRSLEREVGIALRARQAGVTVGIATAHLLKNVPAVFLVYVATTPRARGVGVGRALVEQAWHSGAAALQAEKLDAIGLVWETDDPGAVRFFQRLGGELLSRPYMQPPVDGLAPVPLRLMFRPAPGMASPIEATLDALVRAMYFEKYGALNGIPADVLSGLL